MLFRPDRASVVKLMLHCRFDSPTIAVQENGA